MVDASLSAALRLILKNPSMLSLLPLAVLPIVGALPPEPRQAATILRTELSTDGDGVPEGEEDFKGGSWMDDVECVGGVRYDADVCDTVVVERFLVGEMGLERVDPVLLVGA